MKTRSFLIFCGLCGFSLFPSCNYTGNTNLFNSGIKKPEKKTEIAYWARVTYYHAYEDKWGAKVAANSQIKNKPGFGVAAHPDFKFFTNIRIPALKGKLDSDDEFQVIDRGSAVTKRKAFTGKGISGKNYVFDVFIPKNKMREYTETMPQYTWVIVEM